MSLSERQQIFLQNAAKLILYIFSQEGYSCAGGELYRTPEQAALNAAKGSGIKNSLHCKKLAIDLLLFKDGIYLADGEHYKQFGHYWMTLHPANRYGGDWDKDGIDGEPGETDFNHFEMQEA